jgi:hypothetical protein
MRRVTADTVTARVNPSRKAGSCLFLEKPYARLLLRWAERRAAERTAHRRPRLPAQLKPVGSTRQSGWASRATPPLVEMDRKDTYALGRTINTSW